MGRTFPDIDKLSPHLFWDVKREECNWEHHKEFIVQRVLDFGLLEDWKLLNKWFTVNEIAEVASKLRNLDPRSLAFISAMSKKPLNEFRCYTTMQSMPQHWNF
jgi:hypothetical protein